MLEHLILVAAIRKGDQASGAEMVREIKECTGRDLSGSGAGGLYIVLRRLEEKGFVRSHWGEPTSVSGGRAKRLYEVTTEGRKAVVEAKKMIDGIWGGVNLDNRNRRGKAPKLNLNAAEVQRRAGRTGGDQKPGNRRR